MDHGNVQFQVDEGLCNGAEGREADELDSVGGSVMLLRSSGWGPSFSLVPTIPYVNPQDCRLLCEMHCIRRRRLPCHRQRLEI